MDDNFPAEVPAHWAVYFAVADADATVAKVTELGGAVVVPPTDIPQGRFAMLVDPQGAAFNVIRLASS
jgi:predicted enzyme related to lactoylglutathione lyase